MTENNTTHLWPTNQHGIHQVDTETNWLPVSALSQHHAIHNQAYLPRASDMYDHVPPVQTIASSNTIYQPSTLPYPVHTAIARHMRDDFLADSAVSERSCSPTWGNTPPSSYTLDDGSFYISSAQHVNSTDATPSLTTHHVSSHPRVRTHTFEQPGDRWDSKKARQLLGGVDSLKRRSSSHRSRKGRFFCAKPNCDREFNTREDCRRHEQTVHMDHKECKGYRCAVHKCPKPDKIWTRRDNFKLHLLNVHGIGKNSPQLEHLVHLSSRSNLGADARFPFHEVAPEVFSADGGETDDSAINSPNTRMMQFREDRLQREQRRRLQSNLYAGDNNIERTHFELGYQDSRRHDDEPDWELLTNEDY